MKYLAKYFLLPQRVILSIMAFLAIFNAYTMRVCISVAITEMTVKKATTGNKNHSICSRSSDFTRNKNIDQSEKYDWDEKVQGTILSAFFWGYVITHLPGGMIADRYGGKWPLCIGLFSTAIFTIATPTAIDVGGVTGLIGLRALMGLGEGVTFPSLSVLLSSWVPRDERSRLGAFVLGGGQIGAVLGTAVTGLIIDQTGSWRPVFYFWGAVGVLWFILFVLLCYSSPQQHPFIKDSELEYLTAELGSTDKSKKAPIPWGPILTSAPMIALVCAQIGHDWGFYAMVTDLPKYMADVLLLSIKDNGLYSALPYLNMWIISILSGFIADWALHRNYMSITLTRKFWTIVAAVGPAIFIVAASYAGCDKFLVIALFTTAMGLMGTYYAGMKLNPLDLSPNYSGTIMAITNGIGAITGVIVPISVGFMTPNADLYEWRRVFWLAFFIFMITSVIYGIWASGEIQPWNDPVKYKEDKEKAKAAS